MAIVDHLVYAVSDLSSACDRFESQTGVRPAFGGSHSGRGTHNALVSLGGPYLELIAPDPHQPDPPAPRPFGVDAASGPCLVTFAARPDPGSDETIESLAAAMRAAGHDPGPITAMSRATPEGSELHWRLTMPTTIGGGLIPFLIDWGDTEHPSTVAPGGVTLTDLTGSAPQHESVNVVLGAIGLPPIAADGDGGLGAILTADGHPPLVL